MSSETADHLFKGEAFLRPAVGVKWDYGCSGLHKEWMDGVLKITVGHMHHCLINGPEEDYRALYRNGTWVICAAFINERCPKGIETFKDVSAPHSKHTSKQEIDKDLLPCNR